MAYTHKHPSPSYFTPPLISLQVNAAAEYLWTSGKKHVLVNHMELCSVLNTVIRDDYWDEVQVCSLRCHLAYYPTSISDPLH